jgi:hypothetical protein
MSSMNSSTRKEDKSSDYEGCLNKGPHYNHRSLSVRSDELTGCPFCDFKATYYEQVNRHIMRHFQSEIVSKSEVIASKCFLCENKGYRIYYKHEGHLFLEFIHRQGDHIKRCFISEVFKTIGFRFDDDFFNRHDQREIIVNKEIERRGKLGITHDGVGCLSSYGGDCR